MATLNAEEKREHFGVLVRSEAWQLLLSTVVADQAKIARGKLFSGAKTMEEVVAAQSALRTLQMLVTRAYQEAGDEERIPPKLLSLWTP